MTKFFMHVIIAILFSICNGNIDNESSRTFATCDGNIDLNKPYRIVVNANDKGDTDKLLFQQFEIPSSDNDLLATSILIEVKAIGINYIDTYHRNGLYPGVTNIGLEGAGIVKMIGTNVTKYNINDKVFWFGIQGSYATHLIVDENTLPLMKFTSDMLQIMGENIDNNEDYIYKFGASIGIQVLTAHYLSNSITNINNNTFVLIHSGAGGTGNILIQMIKNILNANLVISTVGSENKYNIAKSAGADEVIIGYDKFYEKVMDLTNGKGVDVVYDGVGKHTWKNSLKCVKQRGWIIYFGNASGKMPNIDILELTKQGSISLIRPSLRHYVTNEKEINDRYNDVFDWIKYKKLRIIIGHEFKLYDVKQAHQMLESRKTVNKILLIP
eukprot:508197_1